MIGFAFLEIRGRKVDPKGGVIEPTVGRFLKGRDRFPILPLQNVRDTLGVQRRRIRWVPREIPSRLRLSF